MRTWSVGSSSNKQPELAESSTLGAEKRSLYEETHIIMISGGISFLALVCVCVCVFSSHSFWTSSSLDVPAGVSREEGHTGFLVHLLSAVRALIFLARRIQP